MSLINDALKRARQAQQQQPPPPQQFQPVESAQVRSRPSYLLPGVIIILLVAGGVLIGLALNRHGATQQVAARTQQGPTVTQPTPQPVAKATSAAQPSRSTAPAPPAALQNLSVVKPGSVAVETPVKAQPVSGNPADGGQVQQAVVETAPTKPAVPTLRGIYFNPSRPSAVLNSKSVFVGSSVGGFRVVEISRDTVTIVGEGQTNVLTLPE